MTARERFTIHGRVRLTEKGRRDLCLRAETGVVRGFVQKPDRVQVQVDGNRTVGLFHQSYWEPDPILPVCHLLVRAMVGAGGEV